MATHHRELEQQLLTRGGRNVLAVHVPEWVDRALCAQTDPELFFPPKGGSARLAKQTCRRCPVAVECLDYALDYERGDMDVAGTGHGNGIYGGLGPRERRAILREERRAAS